jgi:hypothetical protein
MWTQVQQALTESTTVLMTTLAKLLPGLVALIIAVLLSTLFGWMFAAIVRRVLRGFNFDERVADFGIADLSDWSPSRSPTLLLSRLIFWTLVLLGLLIGIAALDATLTSQMVVRVMATLPDLLTALLLLLIGQVLARFLSRGVLIGAVNMNVEYARFLSVGVKWLALVLSTAMALDHLGIAGRIVGLAFGILFGGIVLTLSLAVGLGSKDLVARSLEQRDRKAAEAGEQRSAQPFQHL